MMAIDLYCGLGGWAHGLLAEGWDVVGFDIKRHDYGTGGYPGHLVLQDVTTLHGSQFKNAGLIVASPPCQAYSYRAMPWKRAKVLPPPDNTLFETCFRIQREACEAAGHHIPLIVENVRGAQKWVGRAKWNYGSFYLWGDVPALMPKASRSSKVSGQDWNRYSKTGEVSPHWRMEAIKTPGHLNIRDGHSHTRHLTNPAEHIKNNGGSWFAVANNTTSGKGQNPVTGIKQHGSGRIWFDTGICKSGSQTSKRKAASAMIAKIPYPLASYIGRCFLP